MKDFQEITVMSMAGKMYNKTLLNCIYGHIDYILCSFNLIFTREIIV